MASSVSCGYAAWLDGGTYAAELLRFNHIAATFLNTGNAQVYGGILPSGGQLALSAPVSGMSVNVATGYVVCPSSSGSVFGGYLFGLSSASGLTVATSDPTNPRVDMVAAYVYDDGASDSAAFVAVLTGTPASGATLSNLTGVPAAPANSTVIGWILVPASSSNVTAGNLLAASTLTTAQGGILPVVKGSQPAGYTGMYLHDPSSGRLLHNPASGPVQPVLLPYAPVQATTTSTSTSTGAIVTAVSLTFTTDGVTDWEYWLKWPIMRSSVNAAFGITVQLAVDGTTIDSMDAEAANTTGGSCYGSGGMLGVYTSSGAGNRPAAGTHTLAFTWQPAAGSGTVTLIAASGNLIALRASPVPL